MLTHEFNTRNPFHIIKVLTQYETHCEMEEIALFLYHRRVIGNAFDSLMQF